MRAKIAALNSARIADHLLDFGRYRLHDCVQIRSKKCCMLAIPCLLPTGYRAFCFRMASSPHENGFVRVLAGDALVTQIRALN